MINYENSSVIQGNPSKLRIENTICIQKELQRLNGYDFPLSTALVTSQKFRKSGHPGGGSKEGEHSSHLGTPVKMATVGRYGAFWMKDCNTGLSGIRDQRNRTGTTSLTTSM
ncbi:uncharacterized protein ACOB8E_006685 isoform 1-T3 [Sarcophilus harrisii]